MTATDSRVVPDATLIGSEWQHRRSTHVDRRVEIRACEWRFSLPYYEVREVSTGRHSWVRVDRLPKVYRMVKAAGR